jgi:MFS family permease
MLGYNHQYNYSRLLEIQQFARNVMNRHFSDLWQDFNFLKLWAGQTASLFGSQMTALALPLLAANILQATPQQMGLLGFVQYIPWLLLGLFAGVWVDRPRRRPIMLTADVARTILLSLIPLTALLGLLRSAIYG